MEHSIYTERVGGSSPSPPTSRNNVLGMDGMPPCFPDVDVGKHMGSGGADAMARHLHQPLR